MPYYTFDHDTKDYDRTYYPEGMENVPKPFAIVKANEHMIRTNEYLICYNTGLVGKTRDFVDMARRREEKGQMHIENMADNFLTVSK